MSKHTPGPWNFRTAYNGDCGISADGTGVFVEAFAEIRNSGENAREEAGANAKLIAAAPDLLEAGRNILDTFEAWDGMSECPVTFGELEALRNAIAKAEAA